MSTIDDLITALHGLESTLSGVRAARTRLESVDLSLRNLSWMGRLNRIERELIDTMKTVRFTISLKQREVATRV